MQQQELLLCHVAKYASGYRPCAGKCIPRAIRNCLIQRSDLSAFTLARARPSDAWLACPFRISSGPKNLAHRASRSKPLRTTESTPPSASPFAGIARNLLIFRPLSHARVIRPMDRWGPAPYWFSPPNIGEQDDRNRRGIVNSSPSFVNTRVTNSGKNTPTSQEQRDSQLQAHGKNAPGVAVPVMVAAIVAVIGIAALFLMDFAPWNSPQGNDLGMRSAAVSRAGATARPSDPSDFDDVTGSISSKSR